MGKTGPGSLGAQDASPSGSACSSVDPVKVFNASTSFALGDNLLPGWLNKLHPRGNFWVGAPGAGVRILLHGA